ncbi:MAG: hypothetical protein DRJ47_00860 [Thermoprotei archaeon]|nr:MAG: hypothetical protein DRJ47_00860 [Thermoprotei archaeon]
MDDLVTVLEEKSNELSKRIYKIFRYVRRYMKRYPRYLNFIHEYIKEIQKLVTYMIPSTQHFSEDELIESLNAMNDIEKSDFSCILDGKYSPIILLNALWFRRLLEPRLCIRETPYKEGTRHSAQILKGMVKWFESEAKSCQFYVHT